MEPPAAAGWGRRAAEAPFATGWGRRAAGAPFDAAGRGCRPFGRDADAPFAAGRLAPGRAAAGSPFGLPFPLPAPFT
ncbi:MAG: hypothetical protein ACRDHP_13115, partial [Ktedonobacterales bacterium]